MSARIANPPHIGHIDRLGLTLFLAASLHALIILGIGFDYPDPNQRETPPLEMEITLVHSHSEEPPEKADYLAQVSQRGGGNVEEKVRAASQFANPVSDSRQGDAAESRPAQAPAPRPETEVVMAAEEAPRRTPDPPPEPSREIPEHLDSSQLLQQRNQEIARLSAEIRQRSQAYSQMPRRKTVSANTREYKYASYMEAWRMKVERIGNLNYPEEARRRNLSGSLMLDVTLRADGSIEHVRVVRSSGKKLLDDAAVRIVKLAAPYAPFPEHIRRETDLLQIIRTWQFQDNRFGR